MTSDAKIGLLLGLLFIFIISFVINGFPSFNKEANNNELTANMVGPRNKRLGIGSYERKVSREIINPRRPVVRQVPEVQVRLVDEGEIRFQTPLPESIQAEQKNVEVQQAAVIAAGQPLPGTEKKESRQAESSKRGLQKFYIVSEGDNLAVIANNFYGSEDGNKRINVKRIFEANRELLKSPDEVYPGQKLSIPPLSASASSKSKLYNMLASPMLEKVKSIGKRHLSADGRKTKKSRWYVVQEGDSLWRIAAERLGDGGRYGEIVKLNAGILDDEDTLTVGMRLKMPAR